MDTVHMMLPFYFKTNLDSEWNDAKLVTLLPELRAHFKFCGSVTSYE